MQLVMRKKHCSSDICRLFCKVLQTSRSFLAQNSRTEGTFGKEMLAILDSASGCVNKATHMALRFAHCMR